MRLLAVVVVALITSACSTLPSPTPTATTWGDRVPEAAPDVIAAQPVVARGSDTITLLPVSPTGAVVGVAYAYDMPHCGINSSIDVDGSFWDAVGIAPTSVGFDGQPGFFRLTSPTEAAFTATNGRALRLVRHEGTKEFPFCS